jgi:hypothetical protein
VHPSWFGFDVSVWPVAPKDWAALNGAYLLVLLGVLAHWVLERVKLNRSGTDVTPLSEWLIWLHVNEVLILVRIATVWLMVALGVAFKSFMPGTGVQPVTYFTAGYFIDNTFHALVGRFNTFSARRTRRRRRMRRKRRNFQAASVSAFNFSAVLTLRAGQAASVSAFNFSAVLTLRAGYAASVSAFNFSAVLTLRAGYAASVSAFNFSAV